MMKRLFISQPMRGKTDEEIGMERQAAISAARAMLGEDVEVIESFIHEDAPEGANAPLWFLARSLRLMAGADVAYFAPGWEEARGCRIERECAAEYGVAVIQ